MSEQDREREQTLDEWWSSVIKRAFEQRHSEAYIAWHDMQAATAAAVPPGHVVMPVCVAKDAERYRWLLGKGSVEKDRGLGLVTINFSFPCLGPRPGIEEAIIRAIAAHEQAEGK